MTGAIIKGTVKLYEKQVIHSAIGQQANSAGRGNGGTFLIRELPNGSFEPLLIAGGAGGDDRRKRNPWCNAQLSQYGNGSIVDVNNHNIGSSGTGTVGNYYNGGSGYALNPPNAKSKYPKCFADGMSGGVYSTTLNSGYDGGFGGGGIQHYNGGGGGFTGGNGTLNWNTSAGGGGSFNIDPNGTATHGWYEPGKCTFRFIKKL